MGWEVLRPWAAWPVLAAYGVPMLALAGAVGWGVARLHMAEEHQAIAKRETAALACVQAGEAIQQQARTALEQAAQREQAADERIAATEFRLKRSVDINIGLRRQLQKLKAQAKQGTMGHC